VAITFSTYFCRLFFFGCDADGKRDSILSALPFAGFEPSTLEL
jgi:hypothetical protein